MQAPEGHLPALAPRVGPEPGVRHRRLDLVSPVFYENPSPFKKVLSACWRLVSFSPVSAFPHSVVVRLLSADLRPEVLEREGHEGPADLRAALLALPPHAGAIVRKMLGFLLSIVTELKNTQFFLKIALENSKNR